MLAEKTLLKTAIISFCSSLGLTLLLIERTTIDPLHLWVIMPTPISEEDNDDDHETSDQVTTRPRRSNIARSAPEWYGNPILEVMLLDHDEPTHYEEAMMSPDATKWLRP